MIMTIILNAIIIKITIRRKSEDIRIRKKINNKIKNKEGKKTEMKKQ